MGNQHSDRIDGAILQERRREVDRWDSLSTEERDEAVDRWIDEARPAGSLWNLGLRLHGAERRVARDTVFRCAVLAEQRRSVNEVMGLLEAAQRCATLTDEQAYVAWSMLRQCDTLTPEKAAAWKGMTDMSGSSSALRAYVEGRVRR